MAKKQQAVEAMTFEQFAGLINQRYTELARGELYTTNIEDANQVYLDAFPEGTNPVFRERREFDCAYCRNFIVRLGSLAAIVDGAITSVWDVPGLGYPFDVVAASLHKAVCSATITGIFRTSEPSYGVEYNYETKNNRRWNHFHGKVGQHKCSDVGTEIGRANGSVQVMHRGLEELKPAAIDEVLDLIGANSLYRGEEFKNQVANFRTLQQEYAKAADKQAFVWANYKHPAGGIRNNAIGTLLVALSEGTELEVAVAAFERMVAPTNYKRPTALITPRMIEDAVAKLRSLNLEPALERRFARIEDVTVNNVLFVDNSVRSKMKDSLTSKLLDTVKPAAVAIDNPVEITIDEFLSAILPQASEIDMLVEGRHAGNFVSLTAPVHTGVERLFKWDNNFAWSYAGDLTDGIKERVKAAGGNVNALMRVSLAWYNYDDLDIHAHTPDGNHIYFGAKQGILDVDMNAGYGRSRTPVENLAFNRLVNGTYRIVVNNYNRRETVNVGFELEFEFGGQLHKYVHANAVPNNGNILALEIDVLNGAVTAVRPGKGVQGGAFSREKWGVKTETLVKVDTIMLSPNHWDENKTGNKHWIFALSGCKNPDETRGIYNEFLRGDLEEHRKVFEVLGNKTKCPVADQQISGLGFSSTKQDSVVVVVRGAKINRAIRIKF